MSAPQTDPLAFDAAMVERLDRIYSSPQIVANELASESSSRLRPASSGSRSVAALNERGFRAGPPDGVLGPSTQVALRNFQMSENLEATGQLNRQTLQALGVQAG
jgi:peptidoglycan hydrolase-like protein with peptidoglycan-binding domain